jgi:hypothetical protein
MDFEKIKAERLFAETYATVEAQLHAIDNHPVLRQIAPAVKSTLQNFAMMREGKVMGKDYNPHLEAWERGPMAQANAIAKALRKDPRGYGDYAPKAHEVMGDSYEPSRDGFAKATMDVGYITDLAALTGGQALGLISMDTRVVRGTVRPDSCTLYNMLRKTRANQMVDFWVQALSTGGALPGSGFAATSSVTSGAITANNGSYDTNYATLKMLIDGRAMTVALAAQASFVDLQEQESANAAISQMASMDWAIYWGNSTLYSTQPNGLAQLIPAGNVYDFQAAYAGSSLSQQQFLFNFIYEIAGIQKSRNYGRTTHAFMDPLVAGDIQSLTTSILNNILNLGTAAHQPLVVNGDFRGMKTRFGDIQFPMDLFIAFRDRPAASIVNQMTGVSAVNTGLNAPTSVTAAVSTGTTAGSEFSSTYSGGPYVYAVAAADSSMTESALTYTATVSGIPASGSVTLTITPNGSSQAAFRVFRSGLGYTNPGTQNPSAFRLIGEVAANGSTAVTFTDLNTKIPGSMAIFLLDLDDEDDALDYRWLLPITKVDLFAQNLFMPWAITHIGTPRIKMPKYHAMIKNYVPTTPEFNPLVSNVNATPRYSL